MLKLLVYCESIVIIYFCRSQWPRSGRCGVYDCSRTGIVGSNLAGGMDVSLL